MDWAQLEDRQPSLARLGRQRLLEPGVVLVATIRGDGTPRVSPVEPFVLDGTCGCRCCGNRVKQRICCGIRGSWCTAWSPAATAAKASSRSAAPPGPRTTPA